jgi:hypothetical protein
VGPLSSLTTAAIKTHELWRSAPGASSAEEVWFEADLGEQKTGLMFKQFEGRCAVWDHEKGCSIHATAGHKLKPVPCQQYPYTLTRTSRGVYVGLQVSCRSLTASLKAGAESRPTEVAQRLAPIVMSGGQTQTLPAPAPLCAGSYIPETAIEEWWRWAVKVVEQGLSELEAKGREYMKARFWPNVVNELNEYVHEWLLRVDETDDGEQWLDYERWLAQSILPTRYEVREAFVDELHLALQEAAAIHQREGRWREMKRVERLYDALEVWAERWPLPPPRWRGAEGDRLMLMTTLEAVYSHRLFLQGDLVFGLSHLKLHLELAEAMTRINAHLAGRALIEPSEVNDALALVYQAFKEPVVDGALKRWAGGLRWIMSPSGIPYRHGLGTLEPHLFKHPSHMQLRLSAERARQIEREAGESALKVSPAQLPAEAQLSAEPSAEGGAALIGELPIGGDFEGVSLLSHANETPPPEVLNAPKASPADPYPVAQSPSPLAPPKHEASKHEASKHEASRQEASRQEESATPRRRGQSTNPLLGKSLSASKQLSSPYDKAASQRAERRRAEVSEALKDFKRTETDKGEPKGEGAAEPLPTPPTKD